MKTIKDYLGYENQRNKTHAALYTRLIQRAFGNNAGNAGNCAVLIGHHLTFELDGDLSTENEIPSADTLIFDHSIMQAVFGADAVRIMQALASVPAEDRDDMLKHYLNVHDGVKAEETAI